MRKSVQSAITIKIGLTAAALLLATPLMPLPSALVPAAHSATIAYVVNDQPVTSYDIERRMALLKLMNGKGNLRDAATREIIDQTLREQEMARMRVNISKAMVDQAYANFAASNKLTLAQVNEIMSQSGVTVDHFKGFIRAQIGWGQVLQLKGRGDKPLTDQDVAARIIKEGGRKPSATEYTLEQFVFVVPAAERGKIMAKRRNDAQAMRKRVSTCASNMDLAKTQLDVTVRPLGRFLEQQLPPDWKDAIVKTPAGGTTAIKDTERGVEFIVVCSTRQASDDYVAKLVFQSEAKPAADESKASEQITAELREKAKIAKR